EPEVGDPRLAAAVDHDVRGLQVAVQHAAFVCRTEPAQIFRVNSIALSCGKRPMRRRSEARSSPSMYSIDRKCSPSTMPRSYTRQTCGCETCRATRTSLRKRARAASLRFEGLRNLSATA